MDSTEVIVAALQAACADARLPVPSHERARHIIGLGLHDAMAYVLPGVGKDVYPQVVERYGHHFRAREANAPLFAGALSMLTALRSAGYLLAVATGKSRRGLDRVLDNTGLAHVFHATRCGEESASKPAPDMLHDLMRMLGAKPEKTLMIGDTTHDLQMAATAGVASVAVCYGAHPHAQLAEFSPLACIGSPEELGRWLQSNA